VRSSGSLDDQSLQHMAELRHWLHQHPELSFEEAETAQRIVGELKRMGVGYDYAGVGHAVIGRIPGLDQSHPAIALRAEMDALPGNETTAAPYASTKPGRVHACGHCAHMAMLIGAAELLVRDPPPGPVHLIFQPAEESGGGARTAIADGGLDNVAVIFAGHVTHEYETGCIMVRDGVVTAQSDRFAIRVRGRGGHGARPHEAVDSVVIMGFLITALQTLVSREVNPLHPSVVTIGKIRAGSAPNVIAEDGEMFGSIRTLHNDVRQHIHNGLRRMVGAVAELHNAVLDLEITEGYPPVVNDPVATGIARKAAAAVAGESSVVAAEFPSMGSEDYSYYLQQRPGCFVRFGARLPGQDPIPLHSPAFDVDERVLDVGARFFDRIARDAHERIGEFARGV